MAKVKHYAFDPDYAVPPGATLKEALEDHGMSQSDLAARMGMADKTISQIINGVAPVSFDTAYKLELVLGIPASFWNRLELAYRERLTRTEETEKLRADVEWLKEVPINELVAREFIEHTNDRPLLVRRALEFFGVSSVEAWRNVLRRSAVQFRGGSAHTKHPGYVAAWRRIGVLQAQHIEVVPFDPQEFERALECARRLTASDSDDWADQLTEICAKAGVAVVLTKEIPKASVSGAARWLTKDKALIQLSLKYKTDDQVWFTFFHESGHILKHGKKEVFVDYGYNEDDEFEREANEFARNLLIPPSFARRLPYLKTRADVRNFAADLGIAPGIVVGRLFFDKLIKPQVFYDLKRPMVWSD